MSIDLNKEKETIQNGTLEQSVVFESGCAHHGAEGKHLNYHVMG